MLNVGYQLKISKISIQPNLIFQYKNQKFSGRNGYYQYPNLGDWTGNEEKVFLNGNIISYESQYFIFAGGNLSPYIYGSAVDCHYLRSKEFFDSFSGKFGFDLSCGLNYKKTKLLLKYSYIPLLKGETSSKKIGTVETNSAPDSNYKSGSKAEFFKVTLNYLIDKQ